MTSGRGRLSAALAHTTLGLIAFVAAAACTETTSDEAAPEMPTTDAAANDSDIALEGVSLEVRRDPGCGCCTSWVEYLQKHGATVELSEDPERGSFRSALGINDEAASCHTAVVEGYVIEGHVPVSAIERLLADRPEAVGLALPGMPSDSPGMGGDGAAWERLPVMLVDADGGLSPYDY